MNFTVFYIPAYSPDFAPVEMSFSIIKRRLCQLSKTENARWGLRQYYSKIYDSLSVLKSENVKKMFAEFYQNINKHLKV